VDAFVYHDCMAPREVQEIVPGELYRIPVNEQEYHGGFDWNGQYLVQSDRRCEWPNYGQDLYMIDLQTMEESLVVARLGGQVRPSLSGSNFVYSDFSFVIENDPENNYRTELIQHDLVNHSETRLTYSNNFKVYPKFNGTHVVFQHNHYLNETDKHSTLRLLDIATSDEIVLATEEQGITSSNIWDINSEYVAWRAVPDGEPSSAWDVFLHHIPTGQTSRLNTPSDYIFDVLLSPERVIWTERRSDYWGIYSRDLVTQVEETIVAGDADRMLRGVNQNLVTWFDFNRSGCEFPCSSYDIFISDLENGVTRRLTSTSEQWGIGPPTCKWLFYSENDSSVSFRLYAKDMVAAGILDQNCHLIACDPDTEPCPMLEWIGPP